MQKMRKTVMDRRRSSEMKNCIPHIVSFLLLIVIARNLHQLYIILT